MIYTCCDENRRAAVDEHPTLNGIDWLEVLDLDAPPDSPRQQTLMVRLLKPVPAGLTPTNVRIDGGERIRGVGVEWVGVANAPPPEATASEALLVTALDEADHVLLVRTDSAGDFSTYRLNLVQDLADDTALPDFDPRLSAIDFSFKVECPSDFDCKPVVDCPEEPGPDPDLNHLARDYESIRRLVMDRLTTKMPDWQGHRSPADVVHTLAELIAYVGDLQHYELDAIATEAYLRTARRRTSLRRHALLVDYAMHEGCNARAWLHIEVEGGPFPLPDDVRFLTRVPAVPPRIAPDSQDERTARQARQAVFAPLHGAELREDHNSFDFHTWGDERCCLPKGATRATLAGHWPDLAPGDVLVFREVTGPLTGEPADADPAHRHAVRLTDVRALDGIEPLTDPLNDAQITEIRWHPGDALPFPLCISSETDEEHGEVLIAGVSIALGNIVLVDHGETIDGEEIGTVPEPRLEFAPLRGDPCEREDPVPIPPRFRPLLAEGPVTHQGTVLRSFLDGGLRRTERVHFDPEAAAAAAMAWRVGDALPAVRLESVAGSSTDAWEARRDLLNSRATDAHFVLETESDGSARARFGDDAHGVRPDAGTAFTATYRIGNGVAGNVGADSIVHAVTTEGRIAAVTDPIAAAGGLAPESLAAVRRRAPQAFRTQERAVTPADYAEVTERLDGVQRAAAGLRWTGSWHTVFVTVDREGGEPVDDAYATTVVDHLERYRMAGHDVRINEPVHVSLEIDLLVCVNPGYFAADVRAGLLDALGSGIRRDGRRGLFHPDNFTFGQTVYLSPLYAAAREVAGVDSAQVTRFHQQDQEDTKPLEDGYMKLRALEIARLDNDRNFPEHGVLRLDLRGGK
ncbi:MAG TPA: putative baseplate assembly protein [Candidatus Limnocylindria bacterium]|nr:putative baseplate assembly protein [Candidatus Limnocylindria bacterium]